MTVPPVPSKTKWAAFWVAIVAAFALIGINVSYTPPAPAPTVTASPSNSTTAPPVPSVVTPGLAGDMFGPTSVWRQDISNAPLAPNAAAVGANIAKQARDNYGGAAFNAHSYNTPYYTVPADQPLVTMGFNDCQHIPGRATDASWLDVLRNVPIPDNAVPSPGSDASIAVYSPALDKEWEFWQAKKVNGQWQACWGGRLDNVSANVGGFFLGGKGATATGLVVGGGVLRVAEIKTGRITHAMALAVVDAQTAPSYPAQRSDGNGAGQDSPYEGQRLRLPATVNCAAYGLTHIAVLVCEAAKTFGFIITDHAGAISMIPEGGSSFPSDPWAPLEEGKQDYQVFANFPLDQLVAVQKDFGKP